MTNAVYGYTHPMNSLPAKGIIAQFVKIYAFHVTGGCFYVNCGTTIGNHL